MQIKNVIIVVLSAVVFLFMGCKKTVGKKLKEDNPELLRNERYKRLLEYPLDSTSFPRSTSLHPEKVLKVGSSDWTSGFFAGNLWQLYSLTGDEQYKTKAQLWTAFIEKEKYNDGTHDMGFKVFCSFGKGLAIEENEAYKKIIVKSAQTLVTRFQPNVGAIRSWDFNRKKWEFPVIIDNMMNLELLFEATKISGDSTYHKIAVKHANKTLNNHVRKNNSTYHVVVYDTINGNVKDKITHQGFNDQSSWSRGQAWCVYGFTMCYRYTKKKAYLHQAIRTAEFFLNHKNLPEDGIPYWDFDDTSIPKSPKDVSAATIMCSSLLELYDYTNNKDFLAYSNKVLNTLNSTEYILNTTIEAPFILKHSTGNWPKNDEIDVPIVYADYYYLEALLRSKNRIQNEISHI